MKKSVLTTAFAAIIFFSFSMTLMMYGVVNAATLLTETSDFKDKDFVKGIIDDYTGMTDGGDIEWVWVDPSVKLSEYKIKIGSVVNKSSLRKNH